MKKLKESFDYSSTNWGTAPISNYKTNLQGFELEYLINNLGNLKKQKNIRVLDLGCGGGNVAGFLKSKFPNWQIFGIDVSGYAIKNAKRNFKNINFSLSSAEKLPFKDNFFDLVLSLDTLEHFLVYKKAILEAKRVLKNNGTFFLAVPLEKQFPTPVWFLYKLGWTGKNEFVGHVNYFDNTTIIKDFKNAGFVKTKMTFAGHLIYFLGDIFYYLFLKPTQGKKTTFESSLKNPILIFIKSVFSTITYFESKIFGLLPGGRGHYIFKKSDFFSVNNPHTVAKKIQLKYALSKATRSKDVYITNHIHKWLMASSQRLTTILDFGCADGLWLERIIKTTKWDGVGVDVSPELIKSARRKNKKTSAKGQYFLYENTWPIKKNFIDYCVSFDVFEHVKDRKKEVSNIYKSMKKGGKFLFYTLNPNNKFTFDWLFEKLGSNYLYDRADHDKKLFPDPKIFKKELEKIGFKNVNYELYDGPFNLFWDVAAYAYLKIFKSEAFYLINDKFIKFIYPINKYLDKIFTNHGWSNGYFIWGEK